MGCSDMPEKENKPKKKKGGIQGYKTDRVNEKHYDEFEIQEYQRKTEKEDNIKLKKAEKIQIMKEENLIIKENLINRNKEKKENNENIKNKEKNEKNQIKQKEENGNNNYNNDGQKNILNDIEINEVQKINIKEQEKIIEIKIKDNKQKDEILINKIKSNFILKKIFLQIEKPKFEVVRYNKVLQNRLGLTIDKYKDFYRKYSEIEVDIVFYRRMTLESRIINSLVNSNYYHVYLDESNEETKILSNIKKNYYSKMKLIIDAEIESFKELFANFSFASKINIVRCKRKNIFDMSKMFSGCEELREVDLSNIYMNIW